MTKVLVIHSGARHNYALPAAFASRGMLEAFYTDMCAGRGVANTGYWLSKFPLPSSIKKRLSQLQRRLPPPDVLMRTRTFDLEQIRYELHRALARTERGRSEALSQSSYRRGKIMQRWGLGKATHVFNVLGEGGEILYEAQDRGIPILADIIIAPSTNRIVWEEYQAFPDWGPAPIQPELSKKYGFDPVRCLFETTDCYICPSQFVADDLIRNWGVDETFTKVVPYAVNSQWFRLAPSPQRGRVLFVGTADRRKGIHYLARAAALLRNRKRDYEFLIVGDAIDAVRNHPDASNLTFLGRIPRDEVSKEFASADVFVLPSLAEGSAAVIYEALATGLPVITTKAAGSVLSDGNGGVVVPERNPEALADAIETIVEDRAIRNHYSQSASILAENYTWDKYANKLLGLIGAK